LSENAIACSTKSSDPQADFTAAKAASIEAGSLTSQWPTTSPSTSSASGATRLFNASP
jgi:hypothetical protein